MRDPVRWLADGKTAPNLREVLESATEVPPLPAPLRRRLGALAQRLSAAPLAASGALMATRTSLAGKALGSLGSSKLVLKVVVGSALLGVGSAGTYLMTRDTSSSAVRSAPGTSVSPGVGAPARTSSRPVVPGTSGDPPREAAGNALAPTPIPMPTVTEQAREPAAGAAALRDRRSAPEPGHDLPSQDTASSAAFPDVRLAEEARLLENARATLARDPAGALRITEQHAREHPMAQLGAERELIAIDALLRLGRRDEALRRAAPRLEQAPGSLYAKRLRQLLGLDSE